MSKYIFLLSAAILLTATSCSKRLSYFSGTIAKDYKLTKKEMSRIQFYLSEDVVLTRKLSSENSSIKEGRILVKDGQKVEQVVFKRGTPGVVVFHGDDNTIGVSFESSDDRFLMFGPSGQRANRYTLLARNWSRNSGQISYGDKTYNVSAQSADSGLLVDLKSARNVSYKSRKASGRKVR